MLFIAYMGGISFFTHSHIVNGVTIVHSHPFKTDSGHEHTTAEFELMAHLNHIDLTAFLGIGFLFTAFLIVVGVVKSCEPPTSCLKSISLPVIPRAPPVL